MFPVRYELGFHIRADGSLHSHRCESRKSHISSQFPFHRCGGLSENSSDLEVNFIAVDSNLHAGAIKQYKSNGLSTR
jgi:hypothetical protein